MIVLYWKIYGVYVTASEEPRFSRKRTGAKFRQRSTRTRFHESYSELATDRSEDGLGCMSANALGDDFFEKIFVSEVDQ